MNSILAAVILDDEQHELERGRVFKGESPKIHDVEGTCIRLIPRVTFHDRLDNEFKMDFRVRLRLGALSGRVRFFADSYDTVHDTLEGLFSARYRQELEDERSEGARAGLTYVVAERVRSQYDISGGLRLRPEPSPRVRLQARYRYQLGDWRTGFRQSVFWDREDGYGEKSEVLFDRPGGDIHLFRVHSTAVWSEISQGIDWGQHASYHVTFSPRRRLGLTAGLRGHTHPSTVVDQYLMRIPYRQRIHRDWLFFEIEPGLDFFREDDYGISPLVNLKIEILLGTVEPL